MPLAVGVQIKKTKDLIYCDAGSIDVAMNSHLLVETENGLESGIVVIPEQMIDTKDPLKKVVRFFTEEDAKQVEENEQKAKKMLPVILGKIEKAPLVYNLARIRLESRLKSLMIKRVNFRSVGSELCKV